LFPKFRNGGPIAGPEGTLTENRVLTIQLFLPPIVSILNPINIGLEHIIGNEAAFVNVRRTSLQGKTVARIIPRDAIERTRQQIAEYQRFRALAQEVVPWVSDSSAIR
jgi:hypothetical protein